jgi:hypothetical protein
MEQPKGYVDPEKPDHVCHLIKALYGLKQAGLVWNQRLKQFLFTIGFKQIISDCCLFYLKRDIRYAFLLIHVDDILIAYQDDVTRDHILNGIIRPIIQIIYNLWWERILYQNVC